MALICNYIYALLKAKLSCYCALTEMAFCFPATTDIANEAAEQRREAGEAAAS